MGWNLKKVKLVCVRCDSILTKSYLLPNSTKVYDTNKGQNKIDEDLSHAKSFCRKYRPQRISETKSFKRF